MLVNHIIIERVLSEKNKQSRQRFAGLIDYAVSLKSPLLIPNIFLKNVRIYVEDFRILKAGLYKIIKPVEKNKSEPKPDPIERDQPLFLLENTNHFVNLKDLKKKLTSNLKPVIKLILIRKPLSYSQS